MFNEIPQNNVNVSDLRRIKDKANDLYEVLNSLENSREISLAKTKLEESVMWAIKSITKL